MALPVWFDRFVWGVLIAFVVAGAVIAG